LKVFRSESDITSFLEHDPLNGADTIWVVKSGLNMPNEGSFAAIILEDPIMKASHYDGYARSKSPPIPLLQIPGAAKAYAKFDGRNVLLEASRSPSESVQIKAASAVKPRQTMAVKRRRLTNEKGSPHLFEIDTAKSNEEIREMQKHSGSKAANYAFLRSVLPLDQASNEEHIYSGFAIPFYFYEQHLEKSGAGRIISGLNSIGDAETVSAYLSEVRNRILNAPVEDGLVELFQQQVEDRLRRQHGDQTESIKLRFRSSSNAEDNKDFSGAGLYESHFAYYSFDEGRSVMGDAFFENRTNVARAIKKVWASLWKAEAYQAREQAGIVQQSVRMAILVHPSYRKEESTGVIFYYAPNDIEIVVNKGNVNVQNPSIAGLTPEMHRITDGHSIDHSSRFSLSEDVILSSNDRKQLMELLNGVVPKFRQLYPNQEISGVDIEFKVLEIVDADGDEKDVVMFKQIRPLAKRRAETR
jgi:pyruvate,water dikinase